MKHPSRPNRTRTEKGSSWFNSLKSGRTTRTKPSRPALADITHSQVTAPQSPSTFEINSIAYSPLTDGLWSGLLNFSHTISPAPISHDAIKAVDLSLHFFETQTTIQSESSAKLDTDIHHALNSSFDGWPAYFQMLTENAANAHQLDVSMPIDSTPTSPQKDIELDGDLSFSSDISFLF